MEVHHHAHVHGQNKWKDYLFQFLMLFLAVFCGYLAEYNLEHTIEHKREKQFITTMVADLKSDTAQLTSNIEYKKTRESMADSIIALLASPHYQAHGSDIYYYARNLSRPQYFFPNDRTLQQLKHAGGLRMIRKLSVSDSIMFYDQQIRYLQVLYDDERVIRDACRNMIGAVLDGKVMASMFDTLDFTKYNRPPGNPSLIVKNPESINELISSIQYLKAVVRGVRFRQENLKMTAQRLITFLQEEYNLE